MSKSESGRLLVVDDEIETLTPLCDLLTEWGYEVVGFTRGKDALEALRQQEFDLLLADLVMPEMDGIELITKAAMEIAPLIVCIIVTGKGTIQTAVEAMKVGAFDYILKPIEWKTLKQILSRAMDVCRLRKSEERYRVIIEDLTELICRFLPDGTLTFVNEAYCRYFGMKSEELIGKSFMLFIPGEDREMVHQQFNSLSLENPVVTYEQRVIMPNGEIRWHQWTDRAIFDEQGRVIEFQSVGRDITERKQAEEELKGSHEQLRALAARLSEVEEAERLRLARELHDQVGQNLTALGINLNILPNLLSVESTASIGERLKDSQKLLEETVKKIRDIMADLRPSVLDDYGLLAAIRWYGEQFSNRTNIAIMILGKEPVPRLPSIVETTLFRIAQEALTNIAKHAQASNAIVKLEEIDGMVQLSIVDQGKGFNPATVQEKVEHLGWGLITIEERARAMGGYLRVESEPGKGTTVIVEVKR